ncbi:hypothetical membrane protein (plasmid) [Clavibacter michiganensis subsp. michiganensis NCPPB 382]|uniref:Hypothetical membrane protein n=1 Tax=Clavibacter michiganensis subsp. michiganensis (strain NCPPB 382) TaxID=443906 RepID=A5CLQ4_CLAM3|nr:hypothetical protein [Clavibacter michiganensis]CAM98525.1 hypothetical membrane protein [Clavibacter michiganensis subsp. michiganensis NCPPB 382]
MEPISAGLATLLGSAGLAGAFTAALQLSRASRTARLIEHLQKALDGASSGPAAKELNRALTKERFRLASLALVEQSDTAAFKLRLLATMALAFVALITPAIYANVDQEGFDNLPNWFAAVFAVVLAVSVVASQNFLLQLERSQYVQERMAEQSGIKDRQAGAATLPMMGGTPSSAATHRMKWWRRVRRG